MKVIEKKLLFIFAIAMTLCINLKISAQDNKAASASVFTPVQEGTVLIDVSYGFPYWLGNAMKSINKTTNGLETTNTKVTNTNHICAKVEYMVTNKISIGLDYSYAQATISYDQAVSTNSNNVVVYERNTDAVTKQRILMRMGIHFIENEKFDPYICIGAGYKVNTFTSSGSGLNYTGNLVPVAVRFGGGFRYFFSNNFGLHAEFGIGGPIMQGGLSLKF